MEHHRQCHTFPGYKADAGHQRTWRNLWKIQRNKLSTSVVSTLAGLLFGHIRAEIGLSKKRQTCLASVFLVFPSETFYRIIKYISSLHGGGALSSQTVFKDINNIWLFLHINVQNRSLMIWQLEPPEHLDGIDDANVGVGKVIEATKGEGREHPHQAGMNFNVANRPGELRQF